MLLLHDLTPTVLPSFSLSPSLAYQECHSTRLLHWSLLQAASTHRYLRNSHVPPPTFPSPPLPRFKSIRLAISFLSHSIILMHRYGIPPVTFKLARVLLEKQRFLHIHSQSSKSRSTFHILRQMIRILPGLRGIMHVKTQGRIQMESGPVSFALVSLHLDSDVLSDYDAQV